MIYLEYLLLWILGSTIWTLCFYFKVMKWEGQGITRQNATTWRRVVLVLALVSDFVYNITTGTILFLQLPNTIMFTSRLHANLQTVDWRMRLAKFYCKDILNPISQKYLHKDHC